MQALQRAQQQTTPSRWGTLGRLLTGSGGGAARSPGTGGTLDSRLSSHSGSPNVSPRAGSAQQQLFGSPSRLGQLHRRAGSTAGTQADCAAAGISGGSGGAHAQEDRRATVACVHRSAGAEHEAAAAGAVQAALANKQRKVAHAVLLDPRASIVMEQQQQQHDDLIKAVPAPSGTPATGAAAQQAAATPRASPLPDASALEQLQVKVDRQAAGSEEQQQGQKVPAGVEEPQQQDGWVEEEQQQDGWVEEQQGDGEGVGTPLESPEVSYLLVGGSSGDGVSGVSGVSEPAQPAAVEADGGAEQQAVPVAGSPKAQPAPTQPLAAQLSPAPVPAADDQAGGWEAGSEAMEVMEVLPASPASAPRLVEEQHLAAHPAAAAASSGLGAGALPEPAPAAAPPEPTAAAPSEAVAAPPVQEQQAAQQAAAAASPASPAGPPEAPAAQQTPRQQRASEEEQPVALPWPSITVWVPRGVWKQPWGRRGCGGRSAPAHQELEFWPPTGELTRLNPHTQEHEPVDPREQLVRLWLRRWDEGLEYRKSRHVMHSGARAPYAIAEGTLCSPVWIVCPLTSLLVMHLARWPTGHP